MKSENWECGDTLEVGGTKNFTIKGGTLRTVCAAWAAPCGCKILQQEGTWNLLSSLALPSTKLAAFFTLPVRKFHIPHVLL